MTLPRPLLPLGALLGLYLAAPFLAGLVQFRHAAWAGTHVSALVHAALVSVASASCATALAAGLGVPLGFLLAQTRSRLAVVLGLIAQLPLALPPLASGILLLFLFGYASPIGRATGGILTESFLGVVLAETFVAAPFLIIAARESFAAADPGLADAARSLGLAPFAVFRRILLPHAASGLIAGALLTWLRAFGEFGATIMVAYHPYSLPVYTYVAFGARGLPAMLPVLLPTLAIAGGIGLLAMRYHPRRRHEVLAPPQATPAPPPSGLAIACARQAGAFTLAAEFTTTSRRIAILGESGAGKSLLLRAIAGLDQARLGGLVALDGTNLATLPAEARRIGYVPQGFGLLPHMPASRQIALIPGADPARARALAADLGVATCLDRSPATLSLGQCQRLALVRALSRPDLRLLLLDEPFSALDASRRRDLRGRLSALQTTWPGTTLLVTHDVEDAIRLADFWVLLDRGRVLQAGPASQVWARPQNPRAARLLGISAAGHGTITPSGGLDLGHGVCLELDEPTLTPGTRVGFAIPAGAIRPDPAAPHAGRILPGAKPGQGLVRQVLALGAAHLAIDLPPPGLDPGAIMVAIAPQSVQIWPDPTGS